VNALKHVSWILFAVSILTACATPPARPALEPWPVARRSASATADPGGSPDPYFDPAVEGQPFLAAGGIWPRDLAFGPQADALNLHAEPTRASAFGSDEQKSYLIPAAEIVAFEFLLNQVDRHTSSDPTYNTSFSSFETNLQRKWQVDDDPFDTNQIAHPYAGTMYFGFARSAGLNFWESLGYTFLGSALWETAGETMAPSINDQVATGIGGSFIGEVLFRMASWLLEGDKRPGFWDESMAGLISPPTWINRHLFGDRFDAVFPSNDPAVFSRIGVGGSLYTQVTNRGVSSDVSEYKAIVNFDMDYGLPGKAGYHYSRPFDYFHVEGSAFSSSGNFIENVFVRGMLAGGEYGHGDYRGIAGLYGTYCYLSPEVFQLSTTALALGTTGQWWITDKIALQENVLAGVGYGAAGTTADNVSDRDYHYGVTPQGLVGLRFVFGDLAMLDISGRDYYVTGSGANSNGSSENIFREQTSLMFRIYERHALGLQYDYSRRDAPDVGQATRLQTVSTVSVIYSYLLGNTTSGMAAVH
jgi:hypothetical protein